MYVNPLLFLWECPPNSGFNLEDVFHQGSRSTMAPLSSYHLPSASSSRCSWIMQVVKVEGAFRTQASKNTCNRCPVWKIDGLGRGLNHQVNQEPPSIFPPNQSNRTPMHASSCVLAQGGFRPLAKKWSAKSAKNTASFQQAPGNRASIMETDCRKFYQKWVK